MAKATATTSPKVTSVTLELSREEAFYVLAELAWGNANVHGLHRATSCVYDDLKLALLVTDEDRALAEKHTAVSRALRPDYNLADAQKLAKEYGFQFAL